MRVLSRAIGVPNKLFRTSSKLLARWSSTKSSQPLVTTEKRGDVTLIGINRPEKRNCVNIATGQQLLAAIRQFEADDQAKIGVLHGHGGTFCAGFDLEEISTMDRLDQKFEFFRGPMGPSQILSQKPMIASIDGYAVAGGLELALWCDLRVVEENAVLGVFCRRFGVPLIDGGSVRLPKLIGASRALDMILTGRGITGKEARDFGLANYMVAVGTGLGRAYEVAASIAKFPQQCLLADRRSCYYAAFEARSLDDALQFEFDNGLPVIELEAIKGATRFVKEKVGRHGKFVLDKYDHDVEVTV